MTKVAEIAPAESLPRLIEQAATALARATTAAEILDAEHISHHARRKRRWHGRR
jgi:hypothetical protein